MDGLSLSEVWSILSQIEEKSAIPEHILKYIEENRIKNYDANIDLNIPLEHQNISTKAIELLCYLNMEYFCSKEEKEFLINIYKSNEKVKAQKEHKSLQEINPNLLPVLVKSQKWYEKAWQNIKNIFKLRKNYAQKLI